MLLNTHTHTRCLISNDKLLWIEPIKLSRKVLYHFSIVNKISIIKNHRILILNNFLFKYYPLQKNSTKNSKRQKLFISFSQNSKNFFRIFYQLFNIAFSYWELFLPT